MTSGGNIAAIIFASILRIPQHCPNIAYGHFRVPLLSLSLSLSIYIYMVYFTTLSGYIVSNHWMAVNDWLKSILEEANMAQLKVLSWNLSGGTKENHVNPQSG
jgi:hypothetical protein